MIFSDGAIDIPKNYEELRSLFEKLEEGSAEKLDQFMESARYKYEIGMREFVQKPCHSWSEFLSLKVIKSAFKLNLLTNFRSYVKQYFKHPYLVALMEFPVIFLGASPKDNPALYSLMNYGGYALGTWYPMGGFYELVKAMHSVAEAQGAIFHFNKKVSYMEVLEDKIQALRIDGCRYTFDEVIASVDYHHAENLLPTTHRNYSPDIGRKKLLLHLV